MLTFQTTGVFNFAFGAQAFASAFIFFILVQNAGLSLWPAFLIAVVIGAPLLGLIFDRFLFRKIANTNTTAKVVTGIALLVGIPALLPVIFGSQTLYNPPTILFNQNTVYFTLSGYPVNGHDLSVVVVTGVAMAAVLVLMRFTALGLNMRAAVESRRLVQLDGVNAGGVVSVAWADLESLGRSFGRAVGTGLPRVASTELHHAHGGGNRRRRVGQPSIAAPSGDVRGSARSGLASVARLCADCTAFFTHPFFRPFRSSPWCLPSSSSRDCGASIRTEIPWRRSTRRHLR